MIKRARTWHQVGFVIGMVIQTHFVLAAVTPSEIVLPNHLGSPAGIERQTPAIDISESNAETFQNSIAVLNRATILDGTLYPLGTEFLISDDGFLYQVSNDPATHEVLINTISSNITDLPTDLLTIVSVDPTTGEIPEYFLPIDLMEAGKHRGGGGRGRGRGGVTNCYHVVKGIVRRRISLDGGSAYMAAPLLEKAGWRHFSSYDDAPIGSVCVFNPGGKVTTSGGHIHGHVGVKGAGGIANPTSGFALERPFLGCWNESDQVTQVPGSGGGKKRRRR